MIAGGVGVTFGFIGIQESIGGKAVLLFDILRAYEAMSNTNNDQTTIE